MKFNNPYWSWKTKLDLLARWIIVQSIIYYELNSNVVSDKMFDDNSHQFVGLVDEHNDDFKQTFYYKVMKGFDGSTGFDLFHRLKRFDKEHAHYLYGIAMNVLSLAGKGGGNSGRDKH
ncbi:MAG: hypothetical protein N3B21_19475 [Clostridia bacterium]|nr:hypothetical protein [Clostridia bacterium]